MATPFQIRPVTEDELPAFEFVDQHAFNGRPDNERQRANWLARLELDRTLGAFDGTMLVGVTGVYSFQMRSAWSPCSPRTAAAASFPR